MLSLFNFVKFYSFYIPISFLINSSPIQSSKHIASQPIKVDNTKALSCFLAAAVG